MEIRIEVREYTDEYRFMDSYIINTDDYDQYSYPEDFLHAKIEELRTKIGKAVKEHKQENIK